MGATGSAGPHGRTAAPAPTARVRGASARQKMTVALVVGVLAGALSAVAGLGNASPLVGWDIAALVFTAWSWLVILPMDAGRTLSHSQRENPSHAAADVVLLGAAVASLIAVGTVLFGAGHAPGSTKYLQAGFAVASVLVSWTLVHTVFTLRYARAFYAPPVGGIDFNDSDDPDYRDFAYLAFTIGMTFQVSDTDLTVKPVRRLALRHALISFPMTAVIIAATINLVSGLAK